MSQYNSTKPSSEKDVSSLPLDPSQSFWIQASAGSGKTYLLVQRLFSLLLNGVPLSKILCVTFTKAAAFEMKERLFRQAQEWSLLSEMALEKALVPFLSYHSSPAILHARARRLFKEVLEDPYPLKIQTIHSFCQNLLKNYSLEAGLQPTFRLIEEDSFLELHQEILDTIVSSSFLRTDHALSKALSFLLDFLSEKTFHELTYQILTHTRFFEKISVEKAAEDTFLEEALQHIPISALNVWKDFFQTQETKTEPISFLNMFLSLSPSEKVTYFPGYALLFLTKEGKKRKTLLPKAFQENYPQETKHLFLEQERVELLEHKRRLIYTAQLNRSFRLLSHKIISLYCEKKQTKNLVDFEDLLIKSCSLLDIREKTPWIPYTLSQNIDHILVDEAQDTSPTQWQFLSSLFETIREEKQASKAKTFFVVGDEKQSIYSFQGSDLISFETYKKKLHTFLENAEETLKFHSLSLSYRSSATVLSAVDHVFKNSQARQGVYFSDTSFSHQSIRPHHFGRLELWPLAQKEKKGLSKTRSKGWVFEKETLETSPSRILAHTLAATLADRLQQGIFLPSQNRYLESKDILILVQRRTSFIEELTFFLKKMGVSVQGKDRFILSDSLPIQDLLALAKWCYLENEDLLLATVLKGPFFRFSEETLFDLAYGRKNSSLYQRLQEKKSRLLYQQAISTLEKIKVLAREGTLYSFFYGVLTQFEGWGLFHAQFGDEVKEILEIFLEKVSKIEKRSYASFLEYVYILEKDQSPIRQEGAFQEGQGVRILTVHASKGLEAPYVILADSGDLPPLPSSPIILWREEDGPLLCPTKENRPSFIENLLEKEREKNLEEYRRLLYVALTRAKDHLIICGTQGNLEVSSTSWYGLLRKSLQDLGTPHRFSFLPHTPYSWEGEGLLYEQNPLEGMSTFSPTFSKQNSSSIPLWLSQKAPQDFSLIKTISPSHLEEEDTKKNLYSLSASALLAKERGLLLHSLLYDLPLIPPTKYEKVIPELIRLFWQTRDLLPEEIEKHKDNISDICIKKALSLLQNPAISFIFGPLSKGEVAIGGLYKDAFISGRIDRLIIDPDQQTIWIIEFKSDKHVPKTIKEIPTPYKNQVQAYHFLISALYPSYVVKTAFLWIETEDLQEYELLD